MQENNDLVSTPMLIRLMATDLDGTLLGPKGIVSPRTRAVLQRMQAAGIFVVLVSARPPRTMRLMAQAAGVSGLAICCNGALVYDLDQECIVQHSPLAAHTALRLIQVLREKLPEICFACESGLTFMCEPGFARLYTFKDSASFTFTMEDALVFCQEPLTKLVALHPTYLAEELARITAECVDLDVRVTYSSSRFLEISAANVHKASALAAICEQLNIQSGEVIAFGDMPNDLSMLRWAGRGIAVANAHPLVREQADAITLSNAEDGVALVLERLLDEGLYR